MSSTHEGFNFVPRKLNPYENELQFEYQRINSSATTNLIKKNNIQGQPSNAAVVHLLQNYPNKLNEKPIYDGKQQQFLIIQDQETDQEQEKDHVINRNDQQEIDDLSGELQKKRNQHLQDLQQGSIRLTENANFIASPIDLRKIQFEEDDLNRQKNINNIILEIDKNERAMKKLKYMWPYSKMESHQLQDIQGRTGEYFRQHNDRFMNQTVRNNSNIQWDDFEQAQQQSSSIHPSNQTKQRKSTLSNEKKNCQNIEQNKRDSLDMPIRNINSNKIDQTYNFAINPHTKNQQNQCNDNRNSKSKENDNPRLQEGQETQIGEDNNPFLINRHTKHKQAELQDQRGKLESKDGLRNVLLRQTAQKQEPWINIKQQQNTLPERSQVIQSRGASRYSRSRSQTRNPQQNSTNQYVRHSIQSNQVSPKTYYKDLDNSFQVQDDKFRKNYQTQNFNNNENNDENDDESRLIQNDVNRRVNTSQQNRKNNNNNNNNNNKQNSIEDENSLRRVIPNEDGRRTVYYDENKRGSNNDITKRQNTIDGQDYKRQNTIDGQDYPSIHNHRQNTLKSRAQSRQMSRQASPVFDEQQKSYSKSRVKTQQDSALPQIKNNIQERNIQTECNQNEPDGKDIIFNNPNMNEKRRNSNQLQSSLQNKIKFSDPFIQRQLMDFESEQRLQNNEIDEELIKQEQLDRLSNYVKNFNQTTKGNRQFLTLENKRNIQTSQNTHRTLDQKQRKESISKYKNSETSILDDDDDDDEDEDHTFGQNIHRVNANNNNNNKVQQPAQSKIEVRDKGILDNKVRHSIQNDQLKETLKKKNNKQRKQDKEKKLLQDEFDEFEKDQMVKKYLRYKTQQNTDDALNIFSSPSQMDRDIFKKQQLMNILNNKDLDSFNDSNVTEINNKISRQASTAKKTTIRNGLKRDDLQDSDLTQKRDNLTQKRDNSIQIRDNSTQKRNDLINQKRDEMTDDEHQPNTHLYKGKGDIKGQDMRVIFQDIENRKKKLRLDDKETQRIYSYGDYTIIHHPKQNSQKVLLPIDHTSQSHQHFQEEFGEQMNDFLDVAIDCHENSKKKLSPLGKYKLPQSPKSPTRNHLNNITNNYKVKKQQQRSKSVINNVSRGKSSSKSKKSTSQKTQQVNFDEQKYKLICQRIAVKMTYIPAEYSSRSEQYLRDLLAELKIYNPIFSNISYFTGVNILRLSRIYVYEEDSNVYTENQPSDSSFLILYGRVSLTNKANGEFKESIMGETIGEEAVLGPEDNKINRFETARIMEETSMCEITREFLEKFRISCSEKGLSDDYMSIVTLLKKNFIQKKTFRLLNQERGTDE